MDSLTKSSLLVFCTLCTAANAVNAQDWRYSVLGPSFSLHETSDRAPITSSVVVTTVNCNYLKEFAYKECSSKQEPSSLSRGWSQSNPSLGMMAARDSRYGSGEDLVWGSLIRDSFGEIGFMAGVGRRWPVAKVGRVSLSAGIGGGIWNRTIDSGDVSLHATKVESVSRSYTRETSDQGQNYHWTFDLDTIVARTDLVRMTIPFVLPFLTVEDEKGGLGINVSILPKIGNFVPTWTMLAQLTYKL